MKIITTLLLVLLSFTISYAQDGKPSKEETLQYIKSEFGSFQTYQEIKYPRFTRKWKEIFVYSEIKTNSCILEFTWNERTYDGTSEQGDRNLTESVDFSKTESIFFGWQEYFNESSDGYTRQKLDKTGDLVRLYFKQKESDGTYKNISIPFGFYGNFSEVDYKSLKIYKAFQHLRKLCGAPEPISFD